MKFVAPTSASSVAAKCPPSVRRALPLLAAMALAWPAGLGCSDASPQLTDATSLPTDVDHGDVDDDTSAPPLDSEDGHDDAEDADVTVTGPCLALGEPCAVLPRPLASPPCGAILQPRADTPFPQRLSALNCLNPTDPYEPGPGTIRYEVAAPLFSEGSVKARFISGPAPGPLTPAPIGPWPVADGTMLVKTFGFPREVDGPPVAVEVRAMARREGAWTFATYAWDEALGDGVLVDPLGDRIAVTTHDRTEPVTLSWWLPGLRGCKSCHGSNIAESIGLSTSQLAFDVDYAGQPADQLIALDGAGWLSRRPAAGDPGSALPRPGGADVEASARAWLHGNCAHCHQPGGFAPADFDLDLRAATTFADTSTCNQPPKTSGLARGLVLVAPGAPDKSYLLQRIISHDTDRMPPDGGVRVDGQGLEALRTWITALKGCPE